MRFSHYTFLRIRKTPRIIRYTSAIILFVLWWVSLSNPLLPWWLMILVWLGIFLPWIQYRYIWKHFKSDSIRKIEDGVKTNLELVFSTNPKWYQKAKIKIRKFWKIFK